MANHAESGETVASSVGANRFNKVYSLLKPGDYVFWAFGHNDMKGGSIQAYSAAYAKIITEVRKRGATPVIVSSTERKNGVNTNTLAGYPDAAKAAAEAGKCAFIDLHAMTQTLYKGLGGDLNAAFQDGTHHNNFGSYEVSKLVLEGIRKDEADKPLLEKILPDKLDIMRHVRADVAVFDPAHPDKAADFKVPVSARVQAEAPLGN